MFIVTISGGYDRPENHGPYQTAGEAEYHRNRLAQRVQDDRSEVAVEEVIPPPDVTFDDLPVGQKFKIVPRPMSFNDPEDRVNVKVSADEWSLTGGQVVPVKVAHGRFLVRPV